jgi:hypothetical protein
VVVVRAANWTSSMVSVFMVFSPAFRKTTLDEGADRHAGDDFFSRTMGHFAHTSGALPFGEAFINLTVASPRHDMSPALRLPIACGRCNRAWLAQASTEQNVTCPFCGSAAEVVPGESYRDEDVSLFRKIESVIHCQQLSLNMSHRLWTFLSNVSERARRPELLLIPVFDAIPALRFVLEDISEDRPRLSQAAGMMLVAINVHLHALEAHAHGGASIRGLSRDVRLTSAHSG